MRASIVHVTDHALLRWAQRVSQRESNVCEIISAIRKSKVIKKCEALPYPLPRKDGSVYSLFEEVMFVMEPVSINEYRLVTLIADFAKSNRVPLKNTRRYTKEREERKVLERKQTVSNRTEKKRFEEELLSENKILAKKGPRNGNGRIRSEISD